MYTYRLDFLRAIDHRGATNAVIGNILWRRVHALSPALPVATQDERLAFLNEDSKADYRQRAVANRLPPFRLGSLRSSDFPGFSGPVV